jgi:hypothetical protein
MLPEQQVRKCSHFFFGSSIPATSLPSKASDFDGGVRFPAVSSGYELTSMIEWRLTMFQTWTRTSTTDKETTFPLYDRKKPEEQTTTPMKYLYTILRIA